MIHRYEWWAFLLAMPLVYWLLPAAWRRPALTLGSLGLLAVYAGWDLALMLALAGSVFVGFLLAGRDDGGGWAGRLMRAPWPVLAVLLYFGWSKYLPTVSAIFRGEESALAAVIPLGVSYFSFKLLHYVIERRRGNIPDHGAWDYLGWLFLAPIFTAGPIERFEHYLANREDGRFRWTFVAEGAQRIAQGLVKKFLFGRLVLEAIERTSGGAMEVLTRLDTLPPEMIWLFLALSLLYVYLDFSAYSDIAIGSARLFGIRIMENFNLPFLAGNLQSFWQRWHMTLAHWCRSYVYMSMIGLTRNPYHAVIATFAVMGLWHAASPHWVLWGVWHGLGMAGVLVWQRFAQKRRITIFRGRFGGLAGWALTMPFVMLGGALSMYHGRAPIMDSSFRVMAASFGISI